MTQAEQNHHKSRVATLLTHYPPCKPRTTAQALNLLNEDLRRWPGETLAARRARINRQREARMERKAAKVPVVGDVNRNEDGEWDRRNVGDRFE